MKRLVFVALSLGMVVPLVSCKPPAPGKVTPAGPSSGQAPLAQSESHTFDIGDVESSFRIDSLLADESRTQSVTIDEMVNAKGILDLLTLTVAPPHPQQFFLNLVIKSTANFADAPVVMRVEVLRDQKPVAQFEKVWGAKSVGEPWTNRVDVLEGLSPAPETVLIEARAKVILLPPGTGEGTVDPKTVTESPDNTGNVMGNPVRIYFTSKGPGQ